ncbi:ATP synthase regulation protein NCA2 [Nemania sp. FL0916]|nr:ATP synthase regulation protein NCA2 [Nemania sp. FL0916]
MSILTDRVRRLDGQLDNIVLATSPNYTTNGLYSMDGAPAHLDTALLTPRAQHLSKIIRALSADPRFPSALSSPRIQSLLTQSGLLSERSSQDLEPSRYESDLEWLVVAKVTVQTYGAVTGMLLDQIVPLSDHMWYWDQVLSSPLSTTLYMLQTAPVDGWVWCNEVYRDCKARLQRYTNDSDSNDELDEAVTNGTASSKTPQWRKFYDIIRSTIHEKSLVRVHQRITSRFARRRSEIRKKQFRLKNTRDKIASCLGILVDEGLAFGNNPAETFRSEDNQEWKGIVEKSVVLMNVMLRDIMDLEAETDQIEDRIFAGVDDDPLSMLADESNRNHPLAIAQRLHQILHHQLPANTDRASGLLAQHGRPSRLIRYWLPATALLLSSTTILRIFFNRKREILDWVQDLGTTVRDFWLNWVVEPIRKVIGTIRHDANSEIAIMSRDSLRADRESLERMVVDFALDKSATTAGGSSISETQVAEIRAKVREGDVTPILRAYERDLRSPLKGTVRGDLVRTLLIQVQKTKVDVEVAMSGIDSLLRSQELVFGFVGLTPGIFVSVGVTRYLLGVFGGRRGYAETRKAGRCMRVLRNIDRVFAEAVLTESNVLAYKDHGFLICEAHLLRQFAHQLLPSDVERDFLQDLDDLANPRGIDQQRQALHRIRWAYAKWLR